MGWALADKYDPTRVKFGLSEGNIGPIWTSMAYQGFDVELRERRNWPWAWSKVRHKPLMPCEFSLPYYRDWFMRTRRRSGKANCAPEGTHTIATEYAAMYFGDQVYSWDDEKHLESLSTTPGSPSTARSYWETKNLFADTLLSWRTYGMSFVYHAEVPYLFTGSSPRFPTAPSLDPRRPRGAPENLPGSHQATDELSEFGKRVKAATAPAAAYLAGPDGEFCYTDHSYFAGESIRKGIVVLNYRSVPLDYRLTWRAVTPDGSAIASGSAEGTVSAGGRKLDACTVAFKAPNVEQRTPIRLQLEVEASTQLSNELRLTVFPRTQNTRVRVLLFDPVGDTNAMLREAGVTAGPMGGSLTPEPLLIIGRHALEREEHRDRLAAAGFDDAVAQGLRVIVFEQAAAEWAGSLLGLKLRRTATRHAFIRAPHHPCLAGLEPDDFHYFRGDSNLIEARPKPAKVETAYPLHFWHWGNDNIVATYVIEKPQVGAARALLDCGFDLSETPLLEVRRGKGTLILCQLDVTNRYGTDPVATRLVDNLLQYASSLRPQANLAPESSDLAKKTPTTGTVAVYRAKAPDIPGVSDSDLFFRQKLTLPAFGSGKLFAQVNGRWVTSLCLAELETSWQKAKLARIEAALRILNGTPTTAGPQLKLQGDGKLLYPHEWTYVESMKANFDPYVYWRW